MRHNKCRIVKRIEAGLAGIALTHTVGAVLCMTMLTAPPSQAQAVDSSNTLLPASRTTVIEPEILWHHAYGNDDLFATDVIQTSDGNFAVTGQRQIFYADGEEGGASAGGPKV